MQKVICMLWAILVNGVFVDVYLLNDIIYLKFVLYSSDVRHNETLGIEFVRLEGQKVNRMIIPGVIDLKNMLLTPHLSMAGTHSEAELKLMC